MTGRRAVLFLLACLGTVLAVAPARARQSDEADRVGDAATVLNEIMNAPDKAIPRSVGVKAEAVAVFPSTFKAGFIFGGQRGRGVVSVRNRQTGQWSPPAFLTLTGGSFGAQIGGESVDVVLVIMNRRGLEQLLRNQFKLGVDAAATAGPVGRDTEASTDIQMRAEILSYSRARGLFAGITLKGSSIKQDRDANERFYGSPFRTRDIVLDGRAAPRPSAAGWIQALDRLSR